MAVVEVVKPDVDALHAESEIVEVPLGKLQADYSYQRDISEALVDEIAGDWNLVASELVLVSDRGPRPKDGDVKGGLWLVNGQHRSKAAQKLGHEKIWARVINLRKHPDPGMVEASFRLQTNKRLGDRPLERFKAQLRSEDPESLDIVKVLARSGAEINMQQNSETGINCVATIEQLYRVDDGALLDDTAQLIRDTFGEFGGHNAHSAFIKGIAWFVDKHAEETNRDRLEQKLKGLGLTALDSRARTTGLSMGGSLWLNYYRALVEMYNAQLSDRNKLHWKYRGSEAIRRGGGGQRAA